MNTRKMLQDIYSVINMNCLRVELGDQYRQTEEREIKQKWKEMHLEKH